MITTTTTPDKHKLLLDALLIAEVQMKKKGLSDHAKKFNDLRNEISLEEINQNIELKKDY